MGTDTLRKKDLEQNETNELFTNESKEKLQKMPIERAKTMAG
jgi:hypothetical protein